MADVKKGPFISLEHRPFLDEDVADSEVIPVPTARLLDRMAQKRPFTIYELEQLAFDRIPQEFAQDRAEIGHRLEALEHLGHDAILSFFGPVEGDMYIVVPKGNNDA